MMSSYRLIRGILGPVRRDIRPLTLAIDITMNWLFIAQYPIDELHVTRDLYPLIGYILKKQPTAIARSVERLSNLCWDTLVCTNQVEHYFGTNLTSPPYPRNLVLYFAYYTYYGYPFPQNSFQNLFC